jgi:predicted dienelactone hydrolase
MNISCVARRCAIVALWTGVSGNSLVAQQLPRPTGNLAVGRVTVHWVDTTRREPLADDTRHRELVLDIWYPAEKGRGQTAEYLNHFRAYEEALGQKGLEREFGAGYETIKAGGVRTHAIEGSPFARAVKHAPILIFSHASGVAGSRIYTAQMEELASHGYVVAAVTHPYDAAVTIFPDGRRALFTRPKSSRGSEERSIAYADSRVEWWAHDIRFVIDELGRQNQLGASSTRPFAGHLDLRRVGAFGHSAGGRAAAKACQSDTRLRACLNQDGLARMRPFSLDTYGWGMDQPFLLIERPPPPNDPISDEELAKKKLTRAEADELIARLTADKEATLRNTGGGSYHVLLDPAATTHMSFSDLPLLQSATTADAEKHAHVLQTVRNYTRAFFDMVLTEKPPGLLAGQPPGDFVTSVKRFDPARRPPVK